MVSRRGQVVVATVGLLAVAQIAFEDALVFLGATGAATPTVLNSPYVLVGVPLVLFLAMAGVLLGWAILTSESLR